MESSIYYFSGTGNSLYIAKRLLLAEKRLEILLRTKKKFRLWNSNGNG